MKILARNLLKVPMDELWNILDGEFTLVFDDGEIQTNHKETLYSIYTWEIHRRHPGSPMLKSHHVQSVLKGKRSGSSTHLSLLGVVLWSVYDSISVGTSEKEKLTLRYDLAQLAYEITNTMYNELSYRCEEYVTSVDIVDFIEILDQKEVIASYNELKETDRVIRKTNPNNSRLLYEKAIDHVNNTITKTLYENTDVFHNPLSFLTRSRLINHGQTLQCLGPRGFLTDIDSDEFKYPILRGYVEGFQKLYDSLIESRSAAKALIFSKTPLQDAEYFSRKLQFMCQAVENLHHADCGAQTYLSWYVLGKGIDSETGLMYDGDLKNIAGKHYLDSDGVLKTVKNTDTHLIGKTINLRAVQFCQHPDPKGICSVCYGQLSEAVPPDSNLGHMNATFMTQKSSQSVLSIKHKDGSASAESIILSEDDRRFLHVGPDGSSYVLSPTLKGAQVSILVARDKAVNATDVLEVDDVYKLITSRVSELDTIGFTIINKGVMEEATLEIGINNRKASLTHSFLKYIKEIAEAKGNWSIDDYGNYVFDMNGWNWEIPILELPLKHFNMSDHSAKKFNEVITYVMI